MFQHVRAEGMILYVLRHRILNPGHYTTTCLGTVDIPNRYFRITDHELGEDVTGGWTNMDNEHHDLYRSSNIVRVIKSKMMRWAGCVVRMGQKRNA